MYIGERVFTNNIKSGLLMSNNRLREYIINSYWSFSNIDCPHFYTVRYWDMTREQDFVDFVYHIKDNGIYEKNKYNKINKNIKYIYFEGFKYWSIGNSIDKIWIINRAIKNRKKKK